MAGRGCAYASMCEWAAVSGRMIDDSLVDGEGLKRMGKDGQ